MQRSTSRSWYGMMLGQCINVWNDLGVFNGWRGAPCGNSAVYMLLHCRHGRGVQCVASKECRNVQGDANICTGIILSLMCLRGVIYSRHSQHCWLFLDHSQKLSTGIYRTNVNMQQHVLVCTANAA